MPYSANYTRKMKVMRDHAGVTTTKLPDHITRVSKAQSNVQNVSKAKLKMISIPDFRRRQAAKRFVLL